MIRQMVIATVALSAIASVATADRVDDNLQRMLEAARQLEYPEYADDRAWLLEKLETIRAPVAVVFGYVDNGRACRHIAGVLSASGEAFECTPIY